MSSRQNNRSRHMDRKCKSCGSHDSACKCQFKAPRKKMKPLASDCAVVNSVICSKEVQKVGEIDIPITFLSDPEVFIVNGVLTPPLNVIVDEGSISQNIVVLKDKVVNIGAVPITVTVGGAPVADLTGANLIFQAETDCLGVCPVDTATETPLEVEGVIIQPVPNALNPFDFSTTFDTARVKIILRTTLTVTRPVIVDKNGDMCDVNDRRCETPNTPIILPGLPGTPLGTPGLVAGANSTRINKRNRDTPTSGSEA